VPHARPAAGAGWLAPDLLSGRVPWRVSLPDDVLAELESAASSSAEPRLEDRLPPGLTRSARFAATVADRLADGPGVVVITGLPVADEDRACRLLWTFGLVMGKPVPQSLDGALIGRVEDAGADFGNPRHRGHKTSAALPFHVDRTDVIGLLCVRDAPHGGRSQIASAAAVHDILLAERPALLEELYAPLPHDRRGEEAAGEQPWCAMPVCARVDGRLIVRYIRRFIESSQLHPGAPRLTARQREALDAVDEILTRPQVVLSMDLKPGELQLLDNFSILHARTVFAS
jgi:Taurine catabolism dioxygenase TauD, TfdA family